MPTEVAKDILKKTHNMEVKEGMKIQRMDMVMRAMESLTSI